MAKRRHKKARHGRRKRRLSAKQRRAIMRNLKKARRALRSKRRGHGKRRKSRKGRKSRRSRRRGHSRRKHGHRHHAHRRRKGGLMQTLMRRGYSREKAYKIAERLHRMRSSRKRKAAAGFFAGLGNVGAAAAAQKAYESGNY